MKNKKIPMRRCVGCMESKPKNSMIRIACYEGEISIDPAGKAKGRGVICVLIENVWRRPGRRELFREISALP